MPKGNSKGLNLPGQFNSHPRGPKPKGSPHHGQRQVEAKGKAARGPQRQVEAQPKAGKGAQRQIETRPKAQKGAQRQIDKATPPPRSPKHKPEGMQVQDVDPYGNYYFALEINDGGQSLEVAHFQECSGLKNASEPFEIAEGGYNGHVHRRPGQSRWENLVLKFATSTSTFLLEWRDKFLQDEFTKRTSYSGSVAIMNNAGEVVRRFHFTNAWPVSWEGPSLSSAGSDLAVETLEIAHDGLRISTDGWSAKGESGR